MSDFCENCNPTPHIIPPPLVNIWLIFDLSKYVRWLCMFLEVNPCFQKAHVFCMDLQPTADPYNVVCNIIPLQSALLLVNVWLIFDLQKYVNWLCVFLEVKPCFQKAHIFCMDLQPAADPYNVVCNLMPCMTCTLTLGLIYLHTTLYAKTRVLAYNKSPWSRQTVWVPKIQRFYNVTTTWRNVFLIPETFMLVFKWYVCYVYEFRSLFFLTFFRCFLCRGTPRSQTEVMPCDAMFTMWESPMT